MTELSQKPTGEKKNAMKALGTRMPIKYRSYGRNAVEEISTTILSITQYIQMY